MDDDKLPASSPPIIPSFPLPLPVQDVLLVDAVSVTEDPAPTYSPLADKYIGIHVEATHSYDDISRRSLQTNKQSVLREIFDAIGSKNVYKAQM